MPMEVPTRIVKQGVCVCVCVGGGGGVIVFSYVLNRAIEQLFFKYN